MTPESGGHCGFSAIFKLSQNGLEKINGDLLEADFCPNSIHIETALRSGTRRCCVLGQGPIRH